MFQKYAAFFELHELEALSAAYDAACSKRATRAIQVCTGLRASNN